MTTTTETTATTKPDTIVEEQFYSGSATFLFPNGDEYEGEFCAHRSGVIWREGIGTYRTKDDQIYKGEWRDDKLKEPQDLEILYPNGAEYMGTLEKNKYSGPAVYILENKLSLYCDFLENKPHGKFVMVDINGKSWHADAGEENALLFPEHEFYTNLNINRGKGRIRGAIIPKETESLPPALEEEQPVTRKVVRKKSTFAKSSKTQLNLNFEESDWFKDYESFRSTYENIMKKISKSGQVSLDEKEEKWYNGYTEFKAKYNEIMNARKSSNRTMSDYNLLELFHSLEYQNSCPPVSVFYPNVKEEIINNKSKSIISSTSNKLGKQE